MILESVIMMKVAINKWSDFLNNNCTSQKIAHIFCKFAEQINKIQWQDLK
jgi:hypothetical protein